MIHLDVPAPHNIPPGNRPGIPRSPGSPHSPAPFDTPATTEGSLAHVVVA